MDCTVIANRRATNILLFLVTYISRNAPVIQSAHAASQIRVKFRKVIRLKA